MCKQPAISTVLFTIFLLISTFLLTVFSFSVTKTKAADVNQEQIFVTPIFEFVLPSRRPYPEEIVNRLTAAAAPGEYKPIVFNLFSQNGLNNLKVSVGDLQAASGAMIPASNIDVRVVKVWKQSGRGNRQQLTRQQGILVPELLLYNDLEALPPRATQNNFNTSLFANTSKQFWLTIRVPKKTAAGLYNANIRLMADSYQSQFPFQLKVWSIDLQPSNKKNIIYLTSRVGENFVTEAIFKAQLEDIYAHGFNGVSLKVTSDVALNGRLMKYVKDVGFDMVIVMSYTPEQIAAIRNSAAKLNLSVYFYGVDEPNNEEGLRRQIGKSFDVHTRGGQITTALSKDTADALADANNPAYNLLEPIKNPMRTFKEKGITKETVDMPNYHASDLIKENRGADKALWNYIEGLRTGKRQKESNNELFYWQSWIEKPLLNRLMSGFFLMTSHLDGIMPYAYQHLVSSTENSLQKFYVGSYDDFSGDAKLGQATYRSMMMAYPSPSGAVPTIQWEALRVGIDDQRYLATFKDTLAKLAVKQPQRAQQIQQEVEQKLKTFYDPSFAADPGDYNRLSGDDFEQVRFLIATKIIEMNGYK